MTESQNFRIALLSGGSPQWSEAVTPLLLAKTDSLVVLETVDEIFDLPAASKPEMIFICHQPGAGDGITAAEQIRAFFAVTPLVLLADSNPDVLNAAVAIGALAVLEPPFSESSFISAFNRCRHPAQALRWEADKQQQKRNRSGLFMQSPCCQLFVDTNGMATSLNDEAAKIFGLGKNGDHEFNQIFRRFFAPYASTYPQEIETALQSLTAWNGILTGRLPDATSRIYRVICVPLTQADGSLGMLFTLHDITIVQANQAQLRLALQAARDCLTLADVSDKNTELQRLGCMNRSTPPAEEIFSFTTLLESLKSTMGTGVEQTTITVPDFIPKHFRGDARRLGYALKAIISGSAAFGESAPLISLSIKERTPARMSIQFSISVDNKTITFDSFQSISDYLVTADDIPNAATGLGLAAVLFEQMNGTVLIRTERGRSRSVYCTVPLLTEADECISDSPASATGISLTLDAAPKPLSSLKILVAEDNLMEQTSLKHLLEGIGCQVIVVGNGKEAVDEFDIGEFDLVLMDILMPEMDGFEATRLIREKERVTGGNIPVVALTSYSLKAIREKCDSVGMNGYLAKPVAKVKLLEILQRFSVPHELTGQSAVATPDINRLPVLDVRSTLENIGDDLGLYRELIKMYLTYYSVHGDELVIKLAGEDPKDILFSAHSLKGMASNIGAQRLAEVARQIQEICHEGKIPDCEVWVPIVTVQSEELKSALENINWDELTRLVTDK